MLCPSCHHPLLHGGHFCCIGLAMHTGRSRMGQVYTRDLYQHFIQLESQLGVFHRHRLYHSRTPHAFDIHVHVAAGTKGGSHSGICPGGFVSLLSNTLHSGGINHLTTSYSTTITSILRLQTLDFSIKSPDLTCKHHS